MKGNKCILHGLQNQDSSLSEFCKSSYSLLLIPVHDLGIQNPKVAYIAKYCFKNVKIKIFITF